MATPWYSYIIGKLENRRTLFLRCRSVLRLVHRCTLVESLICSVIFLQQMSQKYGHLRKKHCIRETYKYTFLVQFLLFTLLLNHKECILVTLKLYLMTDYFQIRLVKEVKNLWHRNFVQPIVH